MHERALFTQPHARSHGQTLQQMLETGCGKHKDRGGCHTSPRLFVTSVHNPKNFLIMKPPNTVFISGIPLCFACIENS